ncbi:MAG: TIGR00282 family metallophosphoesterase [Candidatus Komeilibacteria bacterium]|nr:TIGR00282 family metallophosphoesterase [Candidatus Komeilibacteria bacterium]
MKILFFGDIVGKIGREAIKKILPELKKKYQPDVLIANVENLAHGKGVTAKTLTELKDLGFTCFTSGNHVWKKEDVAAAISASGATLITPLNDPRTPLGQGFAKLQIGSKTLIVVNLLGRVFIDEKDLTNPFSELDQLLDNYSDQPPMVIVDFHAEATSEKIALGWHTDGRLSAILGTHTHVPTADYKILPQGTAYVTDVGMVGPIDSVLGVKKELIIEKFLTDGPIVFKLLEAGEVEINGIYLEINNSTNLAEKIEKISRIITV